jgi:dipeptidyl aminopeptidase/acylaminoacyl peptidase
MSLNAIIRASFWSRSRSGKLKVPSRSRYDSAAGLPRSTAGSPWLHKIAGLICCGVMLASTAIAAPAAAPAKRPFSHNDFEAWRTITGQVISRDGRYLAYAYMPLEGDGNVIARDLQTSHDTSIAVGALPAPPLAGSDQDPERPAPRRAVKVAITSDSRFAVANFFPDKAATAQAKHDGKKAGDAPQEGIAIVTLATGNAVRISGVKNHQLPASGGSWLAYLKTAPAGRSGADLVLRDLQSSTERVFHDVSEYSFARDGKTLVYAVASNNEADNGIFAVTPGDSAAPAALLTGPGRYSKFTWDREQTQGAFLIAPKDVSAKPGQSSLGYWRRGAASAEKILTSESPGIPSGSALSLDAAPSFSYDGGKLFVSTAPIPAPVDPRLATLSTEETVHADLWRSSDDFIQTLQKVRADKDRKRSYVGELDLATKKFTQLADASLQTLSFNDSGSLAFGFDDRPYRRRIDYDGIYHDLYLVDVARGTRKLIVHSLGEKAGVRWSHDNRWIAYYDDRQWFAIDSRDGSIHALSKALPFAVHDERFDMPELPNAYGTSGWTTDGESLLIYDRYDLWQVFPNGDAPRNLTAGFGRKNQIALRLQPIEPADPVQERRGIDVTKPLTFHGEDEATRDTGFYRFTAAGQPPQRLLWGAKDYRYVGRALDADKLLLTAMRFDEYPDLLLTDSNFTSPEKVSNGGAQLEPFLWGHAELINYRSTDGVKLSGMLCKPANFDPKKKYPMIVYIYERLSQIVNRFMTPAPTVVIDPAFYTSNGYIVLMPDIVYTTGHPGQSAYRCVMPAVDAVVQQGYVDENAIGLEGHSWGGYETCYLITQTNRFRAAEAGAIVGNMTSAYAGIGWSSGLARLFKYEKNQSRIGATLPEAPLLYIENSPVFFAPQVKTPLLILHNDHDDIVPWYQGIEFFLALRRAGKEAYFFNYNDEFHSLRRRVDQQDFARRMHQFFDHFLKGAPAPDWMTKGIPYLERDEEKLRFRDSR